MVNIKNKQNMTKFNIKTFVATSVLCVFFNGILIYGMKDSNTNKENLETNDMEEKIKEKDMYKKEMPIKLVKQNKIPDNILFNYKGNLSLLCCCNLWNNKKENMKKYKEEKLKEEGLLLPKKDEEEEDDNNLIHLLNDDNRCKE